MGREQRGKRDGTGPYKNSFQRRQGGGIGRRQQAGQPCPVKKKKKKRQPWDYV